MGQKKVFDEKFYVLEFVHCGMKFCQKLLFVKCEKIQDIALCGDF